MSRIRYLPRRTSSWMSYLKSASVIAIATAVAWFASSHFGPPDISMIYLLCIMITAMLYGRGPSLLAAVLSVAAFDFFFVTPYFTFAISDTRYLLTFATMFLTGFIISNLTVRIKEQAQAAIERERRTASLYALGQEFSGVLGRDQLVQSVVKHIGRVFASRIVVLFPDLQRQLKVHPASTVLTIPEYDQGVARWVFDHGKPAGAGTATLPSANGTYLALTMSDGIAGVIGVYPRPDKPFFSEDQYHLLETFVNQTALAIERSYFAEKTKQAQIQINTEQLRNSLLSSISHDLRTPLAAITGAATSLLDDNMLLDTDSQRDLVQLTLEAAQRLNRLVGNILEVTRLESGGIHVRKEWQMLEEVIGSTLRQFDKYKDDHPISIHIPDDLPPVPMDAVLIGQVLTNLLENAQKYSPEGSPIDISAYVEDAAIVVEVADRGSGLKAGDETHIFEKFYRAQPAETAGVGLGLTICRGIVEAHGGRIWAENRHKGGAVFRFTLPLDKLPVLTDE